MSNGNENLTVSEIRELIITALRSIKRNGIEDLIKFLEDSDFFDAPSSIKYHSNFKGGLAVHSWKVFTLLKYKVGMYQKLKGKYTEDNIIICGLLHDICKVNYYKRITDNEGKQWKIDDKLPLGHGEKSVIVISQFIKLEPCEMLAIRWHMLGLDPGIHFNYPSGYPYKTAVNTEPLVCLLYTADFESTIILETFS